MYDDFFDIIYRIEGGYNDDPNDKGGPTKHGISLVYAGSINLDLDKDGDVDKEDIKLVTYDIAKDIFKKHFWGKCNCNKLPFALALCVFDNAVNRGVYYGSQCLQLTVGAAPDGIIGSKTIKRTNDFVKEWGLKYTVEMFSAQRCIDYAKIADPTDPLDGWMRRAILVNHKAMEYL